jgi:MFS transporter, putative metabolite:H+ symporter
MTLGALLTGFWGDHYAGLTIVFSVLFSLSTSQVLTAALGFILTVPIYILVAVLFAVYVPELFPTEFRLRGVGISNAVGRTASIIVPLFVGPILAQHGVSGVLALMSATLLLMMVVVGWLGVEPDRKVEKLASLRLDSA